MLYDSVMKIHKYNEAMKHIARPPSPYNKEERKQIVKDFYKKVEQPKSKPMPIVKYIDTMNRLYGSDGGAVEATPERFNDKILKRDKYETPKKQIIKKTLIVEKPKPVKPPEWDWRLGDWRDLFDEDAPSPPPADIEKVLNIKKKEVAGLEALLNLHKKRA